MVEIKLNNALIAYQDIDYLEPRWTVLAARSCTLVARPSTLEVAINCNSSLSCMFASRGCESRFLLLGRQLKQLYPRQRNTVPQ